MLSFRSKSFLDIASARSEIGRLRALINDIESLLQGNPPHPSDLAKAPLLEQWTVISPKAVALAGWAINHPEANSSPAEWQTSSLVVENQEDGWVRTQTRFYRLGQKFDGAGGVWGDASPDIVDGR